MNQRLFWCIWRIKELWGLVNGLAASIGQLSNTIVTNVTTGVFVVDTIITLRATAIGLNPKIAFTQGQLAVNDGFQGVYVWIADSTAVDDGYTDILPTGHVGNGRWHRTSS